MFLTECKLLSVKKSLKAGKAGAMLASRGWPHKRFTLERGSSHLKRSQNR